MSVETKNIIIDELKKQIANADLSVRQGKFGRIIEVGDGIARVSGLSNAMQAEMIEFTPSEAKGDTNKVYGVALNLEEEVIGVMILGEATHLKEGDKVSGTGEILSVPVGNEMISRVVNPLGEALDGKGDIKASEFYPLEKIAPRVITRQSVNTPIQTGIKAIDSMIPIGRGQRELIIGDRQTGKTAVAIDTIINQRGKDIICIYVAIGQKKSKVAKIVAKLEEEKAMKHTIVVLASASDPAALSYIAPYAGCAMGEYFMDQGKDVLVVYDDLSKHAWAYRQVSLLLKRPPGREAYPGDVFYLHSRLLERAAKLNKDYGGGSLTALPIIETQAGDVSAYIPTNVISITDGQIYLESDLFYQGIRPAINVGLSVSRVGSAAQIKAMKKVGGKLRLDMAQYRELAAFAQFSSDLDEATKQQIERGKRATEVLKQVQYVPMDVADQVAMLFSLTNGYLDNIDNQKVQDWEQGFLEYFCTVGSKVRDKLTQEKDISDKLDKELRSLIEDYNKTVDNN